MERSSFHLYSIVKKKTEMIKIIEIEEKEKIKVSLSVIELILIN